MLEFGTDPWSNWTCSHRFFLNPLRASLKRLAWALVIGPTSKYKESDATFNVSCEVGLWRFDPFPLYLDLSELVLSFVLGISSSCLIIARYGSFSKSLMNEVISSKKSWLWFSFFFLLKVWACVAINVISTNFGLRSITFT